VRSKFLLLHFDAHIYGFLFLQGRTLNFDERKDSCEILVRYVKETFHNHNLYALKYFLCDILNFANVIGQVKNYLYYHD